MIRVLSVDGGGIRGVIPAMVLAELERRSGHPIHQLFDLMAGTSTGGLLTMAAVVPGEDGQAKFSATELPDLYEMYGKQIFSRTRWDAILSMDNWRVRRYPNTGITEALQDLYGNAKLSEALTDVMITSYDIEKRLPWFFCSHHAREDIHADFYMRDAVRATTAAPTFFEPALVQNLATPESPHAMIDGSMTAINPTLNAYIEARTIYPEHHDFMVVSLGTGNLTQPLPYDNVRRWGLLDWARPLANIMFDASSRAVDYQMQRLLPHIDDGTGRYFRLQKRIEGIDHGMDDISPVSIALLREWASEIVIENDETLDAICEIIVNETDARKIEMKSRRRLFQSSSLAFWRKDNHTADENDIAQTG
ncbi:MAG: patatin-like phospholipase family protein [Chloroflexota bacterium]